ncbi:hypothetical protein [uncultured Sphaerochaeta sp.]|uniref:hypothetical protein n=1 Tax=uncultured Sphaerochaeta sp. TaxID=886478 RepID=UPI002A0A9946|nr:hypothetical protein [uncultured Sphaerochaeta sp.]
MKKAFVLLASVLAVLALSGCMTSKKTSSKSSIVPQVIGLEGIVQPDWVYKTVTKQDMHFETGYGKMSDKQISIKRATVEAKNKIAEWVRTSVKEVIMTYVNDTGNDDSRQSLDVMETISTQVAEATLSGVTTEEMWVDADGGVWVLCSIPLANIEKSFEPASQAISETFFENDAANAANAKMKDAFANLLKGTL